MTKQKQNLEIFTCCLFWSSNTGHSPVFSPFPCHYPVSSVTFYSKVPCHFALSKCPSRLFLISREWKAECIWGMAQTFALMYRTSTIGKLKDCKLSRTSMKVKYHEFSWFITGEEMTSVFWSVLFFFFF